MAAAYPPQGVAAPVPYAYAPPVYKPVSGRLLAVKLVFAALIVMCLAAIVSDALELNLLTRVIDGETVGASEASHNDLRQGIVGGAEYLALIGCWIAYPMWLHRAYRNLDVVAPGARRFGTGWAGGGWFVPIMSLFRPVQIVNDVRHGACGSRFGVLVGFWWALFVLQGWIGFAASRDGANSNDPTELRYGTTSSLIASVLSIVAAILAVLVAVRISRALEERAASGPPAPQRFDRDAWPEPEPGSQQPPYPAG